MLPWDKRNYFGGKSILSVPKRTHRATPCHVNPPLLQECTYVVMVNLGPGNLQRLPVPFRKLGQAFHMFSILWNQRERDGGVVDFYSIGMQEQATLTKCCTTDFLYNFKALVEWWNRKKVGVNATVRSVNFYFILGTGFQKGCNIDHDQNTCIMSPPPMLNCQEFLDIEG